MNWHILGWIEQDGVEAALVAISAPRYRLSWRGRFCGAKSPPGASMMEAIVACALLSAAAVSVAVMNTRTKRAYQDRERMKHAWNEVQNARQTVGTWNIDQIDSQRLLSLAVSEEIKLAWPDARWIARVDEVQEPLPGKRIFLGLQWTQGGQTIPPLGMTFWKTKETRSKVSQP
jgi:hypothetical protein